MKVKALKSAAYRPIYWVVAALFFISGCGGSSSNPESPPPAQQGLTVTFEDMGALTGEANLIRQLTTATYEQADAVIAVDNVEVKISADAGRTIPGWGIGGYALSPNEVEIVFDPDYPDLTQIIAERLPYIVAHELHHVVRWRAVGVYSTLLEAIVFEGMADDFAVELLQSTEPPWVTVFTDDMSQVYFDDALDELDGAFNFEAWFFGVGTNRPQWTGYTLGYLLIQRYKLINPETGLSELLAIPANSFRSNIPDTG